MRLIPVGHFEGNPKDNGRYEYDVLYCAELETFYTRGRWDTKILNPICIPKCPSDISFEKAFAKIRTALKEVNHYMSSYPGGHWMGNSESVQLSTHLAEFMGSDSQSYEALDIRSRPLALTGVEDASADDMINFEEDQLVECPHCGQLVRPDFLFEDSDGHVLCHECFMDISICSDCGCFILDGEATEAHMSNNRLGYICNSCLESNYFRCTDCEEYHHNSLLELSDDVHSICRDCAPEWCRCYECGTILYRDDADFNEDNDEYYCSSCFERTKYQIRNYSYKPEPLFHYCGDETGNLLFMGVELEIDNGSDASNCAVDLLRGYTDDFYIKHDGSLSYNGMEIVTHPCTLRSHMEEFPWDHIISSARQYGYRSHDTTTCGLHVHVNRDALGSSSSEKEATIAKIALLMERFWDTLVKFSRRDYSQLHWCKKLDIDVAPNETDQQLINKIAGSRTYYHDDRYYALNLCNRNTIEFRIFRGSLVRETLMATFQLVENMVTWARDHSVRETLKCSWSDFALYHEYDELKAYMASRDIVNTDGKSLEPTGSKFRVGDMVTVRPDIVSWVEENDICWCTDDMLDLWGDSVKIVKVREDTSYDFGSRWIYEIEGSPFTWGEEAFVKI